MADEVAIPALPPKDEIVSTQALYNTQIALYRNTLAFSGTQNPTMIWSQMVRDDAAAMLYYREIEEKDTDVANALDTLKEAVLERDYEIQPFDDSGPAQDVANFINAQLANVTNLDCAIENLLDAAGYGFSVAELLFDTSAGQASLVDIKDCPQELFLFGDRYTPQIGNLQFLSSPYATSGVEVPEQKFLVFSHRPRSRNRMGRPLLRSLFWSSWLKRNVMAMWVKFAEKGPGTALVRYDVPEDAQQAADIAQAIISGVAFGVPKNFEIEKDLLTIARAQDPAVYEHFYEAMQLDIIRRVLGETLTSFGGEKGTGSKGMGDTHSATKDTKAVRLCKAAQAVMNQQLIRPLVLWNFGPDAPMPKWQYDVKEQEDLTKRLAIDAGLQRMGVPLTLGYLRDKYQIPTPDAGDEIATPNVNAAQVAIADTTTANFSEGSHQAQAERELAQLDHVLAELQNGAKDLYRQRVKEIADAAAGSR
jgi:phage gp29-like protein